MTNLFETDPLHPSEVHAGAVVYYADSHTHGNQYLHGLQTTKVMVSDDKSFILDNGKRFNPTTGREITRGNEGYLYPYTSVTKAMVLDAETKLFLVNEVLSIDFSALTTQQLSMILDVARGAFTQITAPTPCGGGCGDTVKVAGMDVEVEQANTLRAAQRVVTADEVSASIANDVARVTESMRDRPLLTNWIRLIAPVEVSATIGLNDATYELSDSELDDIDEDDEDDEDDDTEQD